MLAWVVGEDSAVVCDLISLRERDVAGQIVINQSDKLETAATEAYTPEHLTLPDLAACCRRVIIRTIREHHVLYLCGAN